MSPVVAEVDGLDIGAADDRPPFVGDDELLVIADQVAPAVARLEQAEVAAFVRDRLEEFAPVAERPVAVEQQPNDHAAACGLDQRVADCRLPASSLGEDVEDDAQALPRAVDEVEDGVHAVGAGLGSA